MAADISQPRSGARLLAAPRLVVVDGRQFYRDGLVSMLSQQGMQVVAATGDAEGAASAARHLHPDLLLLACADSLPDSARTCRLILAVAPAVKVLLVGADLDAGAGEELDAAGVLGAVGDEAGAAELRLVIEAILEGNEPLSPAYRALGGAPAARQADGPDGRGLTGQERRVLARLAHGARNGEIALALGISRDTVKAHLKHIYRKLDVRTRTEAALVGLRWGLIAGNGSHEQAPGGDPVQASNRRKAG